MDAYILLSGLLALILLGVLAIVWGVDTRDLAPKESGYDSRT
jgi:hypothetical protein